MNPTFIQLRPGFVVHRDMITQATWMPNHNGVHAGWLEIKLKDAPLAEHFLGHEADALWRVIAGLTLPSGNYAKDESAATLWKVMQKWLTSLTSITSLGKDK